jgi:hypothetical protein
MPDLREGLDGLQGDMAAHQERFHGGITAEANRSLAVDLVERLDREQSESLPPAPVSLAASEPIKESVERREIDGKGYTVTKGPDAPLLRKANEYELWFLSHALPRIELLLTKMDTGPLGQPSWHQRVLAVLELKSRVSGLRLGNLHDVADALESRYFGELLLLLEESSALFGDWKSDRGTKVMVG